MRNINGYLKNIIGAEFSKIFNVSNETVEKSSFVVEYPKNKSDGELSTNICMVLAKEISANPVEAAKTLIKSLEKIEDFEMLEVAGPGFLNFNISKDTWFKFLSQLLETNLLFNEEIGLNKNINVEYVSANPTGPLHIGHCRGAVFGDVLSNLLKFTGHNVTKEYYINDAGTQIDTLANSTIIRIKEIINSKSEENYPDEFYPGEYLIDVAKKIIDKYGTSILENDNHFSTIKGECVNLLLENIKEDLSKLSINQDIFVSEKELITQGKIDKTIDELKNMNLIYEGILDKPKGKQIEDWEPRKQLLFKSSEYGDEIDRPLQKSDGEWTYFANDIAYHYDKYLRGSTHLIDILGADHGGYIKRMSASIQALTNNKARFTAKLCQMVKLISDGKELKMSKRSGDFITLSDLVKEVGSDSIRFMMMYRKNEAPLEFDFKKVTEQSKENPVFYVQYAHARISSVLNNLHSQNIKLNLKNFSECNFSELNDLSEISLLKKILDYSNIINTSVSLFEPHRIAYYLYELASEFHSLWSQGKVDNSKKFIDADNIPRTYARMALLIATQRTIKSGLDILGVSSPDEMK